MTTLSDVNIENGTVEVAVFTQTEAALAELKHKYDIVPDTTTDEGYKLVKDGVSELRTIRTSIEKERKRIKAPYIEAGNIIDAEAKRITSEIVALEDPLKAAKKERDEHEKRLKEERLNRLRAKIQTIRDFVAVAKGRDSDGIAKLIEDLDAIDTSVDYYDLTAEATTARAETLAELNDMFTRQFDFERSERERIKAQQEREELERKQAIDARINKIRMYPVDLMGKPSSDIGRALNSLKFHPPMETDFQERYDEAKAAHEDAITKLEAMEKQAKQIEEMEREAKAKAEAERQEHLRKERAEREREMAEQNQAARTVSVPDAGPLQVGDKIIKAERKAPERGTVESMDDAVYGNPDEPEMVLIPKSEYKKLLDRDAWLSALEAAGVDNWDGFDVAKDILEEWGAA